MATGIARLETATQQQDELDLLNVVLHWAHVRSELEQGEISDSYLSYTEYVQLRCELAGAEDDLYKLAKRFAENEF